MQQRGKSILVFSGITALTLYFLLIVIYANPFGTKSKASFVATAFIYPYFHQNWNLFVPAPSCNFSLFAWSDADTIKSDIFNDILIRHQSNRFAGYGPLVIAFSNSIHYFEKNTSLRNALNGPVENDPYFRLLEHSAGQYLQHLQKKKIASVKLILVVDDGLSRKRRVYYNRACVASGKN